MNKTKISIFLNVLISIFVPVSWAMMYFAWTSSGTLASPGLYSLRYFTVLSNILAGVVSLIYLLAALKNKNNIAEVNSKFATIKYVAATAVGLTFLVVVAFLGPTSPSGYLSMFAGANFFMHLVTPLIAMIDMMFFYETAETFNIKQSLLAVIPMIMYGIFYLGNLIVNGIGTYPNANDWYGFAQWGMQYTYLIFVIVAFVTWLIALVIRAIHNKLSK